jgi:hypothetical protein
MKELLRNFPHCTDFCDESFVGIWHEHCRWDEKEYWKLDKEIYELAKKYSGQEIPRNIAWPLTRIFSYTMMSIQGHYSPNDGFEIENLDMDGMFNFRERFQLVVEGFFKGEMPKNLNFDMVNPLINEST